MKNFILIFIVAVFVFSSCQSNTSSSIGNDKSCELITLTELQELLVTEHKEDFVVERYFKKTDINNNAINYAKCKTDYEDDRFWLETIHFPKDETMGVLYTTIDSEHYMEIKNRIKEIGAYEGKDGEFQIFTVNDNIQYRFQIASSSSKKQIFTR